MKKLFSATVVLRKSEKRGTASRAGFRDESGQVFMPPLSAKKVEFWKKQMVERGYSFS